MKQKFLKVNKPCSEKWDNMTPNKAGHFCDVCAKTVIDFTQLSQDEILEKMKASNGNMCAKITERQLNMPFLELEKQKQYSLPYSKVAASIMLATSLVAIQPMNAQNFQAENPVEQTIHTDISPKKNKKNKKKSKRNKTKADNFTHFKGKVISEIKGTPLENVKISFITINKIYEAYTLKDGAFSIELPTAVLDNDNVVRVAFHEMKEANKEEYYPYKKSDLVLKREEINSDYIIKAVAAPLILGGIGFHHENEIELKPIVLQNGTEIDYKEFAKALYGEKSSCTLESKNYHYFGSHLATALYGKKAKDGLYLLFDKQEK